MAPVPPEAPSAPIPLTELQPGQSAAVARVDPSPLGRRLLDLGFVPATRVRVLRRAPMGDPTSYELRGTRLCLRRAEASAIWVERVDASAPGTGGDGGH